MKLSGGVASSLHILGLAGVAVFHFISALIFEMIIFFHFHSFVFGERDLFGFGSIFADDGVRSVFVRISVG